MVILDFRLNTSDFESNDSEEITSIKLIRKIKDLNPGIQVIIFSATSKVWNLQAMQDAGADAFIFKENGENIYKTLTNFVRQITASLKKSSWLMPIWRKTRCSIEHLEIQRKKHLLDRDFTGAVTSYLELGFDLLVADSRKKSL